MLRKVEIYSDRYKINLNDKYNSLNNKEGYLKTNNRISSLHQSMGVTKYGISTNYKK